MKNHLYKLFSVATFLLIAGFAQAQVVINEFSAANRNGITDNYGEQGDWIELYNTGSSTFDLSGYHLSDNKANPTKFVIPNGVSIGAGGYLLVYATGRDEFDGGSLHTNFKLSQSPGNEEVVFADQAGNLITNYELEIANQLDHSRGRLTDGAADWGVLTNPTPGGPNNTVVTKYADPVLMDLEPGFYSGSVTINLSTTEPSAEIYYTVDGSEPTQSSILYTMPLIFDKTTVVRARAYSDAPNVIEGFIETNTYFVDDFHTIKVISIAGGDPLSDLMDGTQNEPIGSFELYEDDGLFLDEAVGDFNKHGNDSWAYPQRGLDYICRDEYGYNNDLDDEIFDNKERNDFQRLIIKAAANDNYPFENGAHIRDAYVHTLSQNADMELDERTSEPCIMYVNGEYWGVYELREKVDDSDYTKEYYDQGKKWIDFIKTWGGTWEEYGSWDDWYDLFDFIENNDMTIDANYEYVNEEFNLLSLVDYMVLNTHIVCADWLNWNTAWWRGRKPTGEAQRWRYALWDMDASFGHYINYTGIPDTSPNADPCDNEDIGGFGDPEGHVVIVQALLENETFHSLYVNRYADMNNSFFTCEYMNGLLDDMIGEIQPEMQRQIDRWGGTYEGWEDAVQTLRDFIDSRCSVIDGGIVDCYDVEGPFPVVVNVEPAGTLNKVKVNTFVPQTYPYMGDYYGGVNMIFEALPEPGAQFLYWEVANNSFGPDQFQEVIDIAFETGDEITAHFVPAVPCAGPAGVTVDSMAYGLDVMWQGPGNTLSYEVKWREFGSGDDFIITSQTENELSLNGLQPCTQYEIELRTICNVATSETLNFVAQTLCLTSTEEEVALTDLNIYPNPFVDFVTAEFDLLDNENVLMELFNISGQRIQSIQEDRPSGKQSMRMNIEQALPSGMYLMKLTTQKDQLSKVIVRK